MAGPLSVKMGSSTSLDPETAVRELHEAIDQPDVTLAIFYCSPTYDLGALEAALAARFGAVKLIGCTTAGEIGPDGYARHTLTGVSLAGEGTVAVVKRIDELKRFEFATGAEVAERLLWNLGDLGKMPSGKDTFGLLLIDGLSMQEEIVVSSLYRCLGDIQLFGGSAGDETRFGRTYVYHEGKFHTDAAIFVLVNTVQPFTVFKTQHFSSTDEKMVVTGADPGKRVVTEINGEPAAREFARAVGLENAELTPMVFSSHPVMVRVGGAYYVRSIQKVNEDGSLTFFCAIDSGVVLTVAKPIDIVENLRSAFASVRKKIGEPQLVLGCDCILRFIEIQQRGLEGEIGEIFRANHVVGFATYGEQYNAMHVNQTFTGVALGSGEPRDE